MNRVLLIMLKSVKARRCPSREVNRCRSLRSCKESQLVSVGWEVEVKAAGAS